MDKWAVGGLDAELPAAGLLTLTLLAEPRPVRPAADGAHACLATSHE